MGDLAFVPVALDVTDRWGKTDQAGAGFMVRRFRGSPTPRCARARSRRSGRGRQPRASLTVMGFAPSTHGQVGGPLTPQELRRIVRRRTEDAGLTLEGSTEFGSHSLRSGFCTSAAEAGRGVEEIMRQTGHKRADTALKYIRRADRYRDNAADGLLATGEAGASTRRCR